MTAATTAPADAPVDPSPVGVVPAPPAGDDDPERGDVPGWVLVTIMTAGLVLALWAIAGPALTRVFEQAIARVTGFGG